MAEENIELDDETIERVIREIPRKKGKRSAGLARYWARLTPEERRRRTQPARAGMTRKELNRLAAILQAKGGVGEEKPEDREEIWWEGGG